MRSHVDGKLTLVICLVGLGTRFTEKGYPEPKFLLPLHDKRSMLAVIVAELIKIQRPRRLIAVVNDRYREKSGEILEDLGPLGLTQDGLHFVPLTRGQAETAAIAARNLVEDGDGARPIVFHNGDTLLYGRNLGEVGDRLVDAVGLIDVFEADSLAYSYVEVDGTGGAMRIAEKQLISPWATTGFYGFRNPELYLDAYNDSTFTGEEYISAVYQTVIDRGGRVEILNAGPAGTDILGTPEEYEAYLARSQ